MFEKEELMKTFSRGTLINPINFMSEEQLSSKKEINSTPNNKSTEDNEDEDDYNYDGYNPFSSGIKKWWHISIIIFSVS